MRAHERSTATVYQTPSDYHARNGQNASDQHGTNGQHTTSDQHATSDAPNRRIGRREFILEGAAAGVGLLAGCSGGGSDDGPPPEPISLASNRECDVCGMVISEHPGPNGQIFYRDEEPENHGNPARFDAPKACLFPHLFEHEQLDWTAEVVYVTDYTLIDYEITTVQGQQYIGTATAPETFADARDTVFVVGSEVNGAMGPDFIPFSEDSDATAFAEEFGGRTVARDDITQSLLGR